MSLNVAQNPEKQKRTQSNSLQGLTEGQLQPESAQSFTSDSGVTLRCT